MVLELARALDALETLAVADPVWCDLLRDAVRAEVDDRPEEAERFAAMVYERMQDAREPLPPAFGMTAWTAALTSLGNVNAAAAGYARWESAR